MKDLQIRLRSFEDVCALADLATAMPFRVWVGDGRRWTDARSLMCVISMDLWEHLTLRCDCGGEDFDRLRTRLGRLAA